MDLAGVPGSTDRINISDSDSDSDSEICELKNGPRKAI